MAGTLMAADQIATSNCSLTRADSISSKPDPHLWGGDNSTGYNFNASQQFLFTHDRNQ